jgi:hypothetical protein
MHVDGRHQGASVSLIDPFHCSFLFKNYRPYDDGWVIAAQILSIVATVVSWVWWVTLIISILGMAMFQVFWCCRSNRGVMYASLIMAGLASLASMGVGIYASVVMRRRENCIVFFMWSYGTMDDDFYSTYYGIDEVGTTDTCQEKLWAGIAFLCAALWVAAAYCMLVFVKSGRHAIWEEIHRNRAKMDGISDPFLMEADPEAGPEPFSPGVRRRSVDKIVERKRNETQNRKEEERTTSTVPPSIVVTRVSKTTTEKTSSMKTMSQNASSEKKTKSKPKSRTGKQKKKKKTRKKSITMAGDV